MINPKSKFTSNGIPIFKEMISFLASKGLAIEDLVKSTKPTNESLFLSGLKSNRWQSDTEACQEIFNSPTSKRYNNLKFKIRQKIIKAVLSKSTSPLKYNSDLDIVYQNLNFQFAFYNILKIQNFTKSAAYMGELIISQSIKYSYTEFIQKISVELIEYFSIFEINSAKSNYYTEVLTEYTKTIEWEQKSYIAHAKLMNLFIKELSPGQKAIDLANEFLSPASKFLGKINSVRFHIRYYLIEIFKYYESKDYLEMDNCAKEAISYFRKFKTKRIRTENAFLKKRVEANLILGNHELSQMLLTEVLEQTIANNSNWLNTLEIQITIFLHLKNYEPAVNQFILGKTNNNFNNNTKTTSQRWGLLEAYINFLQLSGAAPESPTMSRYRINKFINETPRYSEDKKGRNIQLIIAQLLFYILDKNWIKMEEKIEALQRYSSRYLRKNDLFRSHVFIKMLLEIPKRQYHPKAILRHTAKYRKRLGEMKPNIELNGNTLEIIPYEDLWELIIQNIVPPKYTRVPKMDKTLLATAKNG